MADTVVQISNQDSDSEGKSTASYEERDAEIKQPPALDQPIDNYSNNNNLEIMANKEVLIYSGNPVYDRLSSALVCMKPQLYLPAKFPDINTDLKCPPTNWLRSHTHLEKFARNFMSHNERKSSIEMAHRSPDLVGEIDVISDSENIKQLLKIPFTKSHISMMVHRIGNTVLIDDFDIHKHLLRQQQEDWQWLSTFYREKVLENMQEKLKCIPRKNRTRLHLQRKNMLSKFLYYSIAESGHSLPDVELSMDQCVIDSELVPKPTEPPSQSLKEENKRDVIWEFRDIRMLIGTDLPIFQAGNHPCISIRLRDMQQPINVLTGLDCWLDNLMCNVPNVAMCYHINGLIQDYKLVKTEDIPNEEGGEFSPALVTDIAHNILSFLKANAAREGHTYWLYKDVDGDLVKLYDLTTLCADSMSHRSENQFSVPVGMLLYRVAHNMRETDPNSNPNTICTLLKTCMLLLKSSEHPQVYSSASYILSDIFLSTDNIDMSVYDTEQGTLEDEVQLEADPITSVSVHELCLNKVSTSFSPMCYNWLKGSKGYRYSMALQYISKGLKCLDEDFENNQKWENLPKTSFRPSSPIPLHFSVSPDISNSSTETAVSRYTQFNSWHRILKAHLLQKAATVFCQLAVLNIEVRKLTSAYELLRRALTCLGAVELLSSHQEKLTENHEIFSDIMGRLGDIHIQISFTEGHDNESHDQSLTEYCTIIEESISKDVPGNKYDWCFLADTPEQHLLVSVRCLEEAIDKEVRPLNLQSLTDRYGHTQNELGKMYREQLILLISEHLDSNNQSEAVQSALSAKMENLSTKSYRAFDKAHDAFKTSRSESLQSVALSNKASLMRVYAWAYDLLSNSTGQFSAVQREYFTKAISYYESSLSLLRKGIHPTLYADIQWDLSTTYFNMGCIIQQYPPLSTLSQLEIEKEITDCLTEAEKYCALSDVGAESRRPDRMLRSAHIHHKLASLHQHAYKSENKESRKRHLRQLAISHYAKSINLYEQTTAHIDCLRSKIEFASIYEFLFSEQTSNINRIKKLESALDVFINCFYTLEEFSSVKVLDDNEPPRLLNVLTERLLFVLLQLNKCYSLSKRNGQSSIRSAYSRVLKADIINCTSLEVKISKLMDVLQELQKLKKDSLDAT